MIPVQFQVAAQSLHAHLFEVTLTVAAPTATQRLSLPVWIPGSYLVREFSKNLQHLRAQQGGAEVTLTQIDKCTWDIECVAGRTLVLTYEVYAFDNSVRTAWLDTQRGFFNGTSLFLRVHGHEGVPHGLRLNARQFPSSWHVATALTPAKVSAKGFGTYVAINYDELVDSPVEFGAFWSGAFTACGIAHRFVVAGAAASFDGARLLADTKAICEAEIHFWHGPRVGLKDKPAHRHYLFMLNAVENSYGGLEHRHSTALICKRADLPRRDQPKALTAGDGYTTLLGLISHEYFHTWNVKRLRPSEFTQYDYDRENYTELLWFFEGFTSYYDDLLLRRAGLVSDTEYLMLLGKTLNAVLQTPGRSVQSVAQASRDAWIKYYRQDENTVNATISYYTKGALIALCLDLSLRQAGNTSLDAVMRALWQRCKAGPMTQDDLLKVLVDLAGRPVASQLANWVHSTADLPVKELLQAQGVTCSDDALPLADQLGLKVTEQDGIRVRGVLRGSAAEKAGMAAGDEWLGVQVGVGQKAQGWRLSKIDALPLYLGASDHCTALIARDQRLLSLTLALPEKSGRVKLSVKDTKPVRQWLAGR